MKEILLLEIGLDLTTTPPTMYLVTKPYSFSLSSTFRMRHFCLKYRASSLGHYPSPELHNVLSFLSLSSLQDKCENHHNPCPV